MKYPAKNPAKFLKPEQEPEPDIEAGYPAGSGFSRISGRFLIGTDRNGRLAAGPDLAGYQFTIRLAGICRTRTGVRRVKYKAAGTCRKI